MKTAFVLLLTMAAVGVPQSDWTVKAEARAFSNDNLHYQLGAETQTSIGELGISLLTFDNVGPRRILGSNRRSEVTLYGLKVRRELHSGRSGNFATKLGYEVGVELVGVWRSTDETTGTTAESDQAVAAAAIEWVFTREDGGALWLRPTAVAFDSDLDLSSGGTLPGFGTVVALEFGQSLPIGDKWKFTAKGLGVLHGHNSVDPETGLRNNRWGYEAQFVYHQPGSAWEIALLGSNLAGSTLSTAVMSSEDNAYGVSVRLRY